LIIAFIISATITTITIVIEKVTFIDQMHHSFI